MQIDMTDEERIKYAPLIRRVNWIVGKFKKK